MLDQVRRSHCRNCSRTKDFKATGYYSDGSSRLVCLGCGRDGGVLHQCSHDHMFAPPRWLPLLLAGIGIVCPRCKAAYDLGVKIEPTYPEGGQVLQVMGLFVGTVILVGVLTELANKSRR
jgi:hypothetical protein